MAQPFPDDELRRLLRRLVRVAGLLEPHDHDGVRASASEVFALGELVEAGPLSQQQLGERLGLEKSTVSRLAAGLERRGWLERVRDPANRRFYRLAVTPAGATAAERFGAHFCRQHQHLFAELTGEERDALLRGMSGLARVMEQHHRHLLSPAFGQPLGVRAAATSSRAAAAGSVPPAGTRSATTANTSSRPSLPRTRPASELTPSRVPVLALTWPAASAAGPVR